MPLAVLDTPAFFTLIVALGAVVIGLTIILLVLINYSKKQTTKNLSFMNKVNNSLEGLQERVEALASIFSKNEDVLKQLITNKKDHENLMNDLKLEITRIGDGIKGQDKMTKAIELASGNSKNRVQASSYYNIARIYEAKGQWQDALDNFRKAKSLREHSAYDKGIQRMQEKLAQ